MVLLFAVSFLAIKAQNGLWSGKLYVHGAELPIVFNFTEDGCTVDSPSQGVTGIKAEKSCSTDDVVQVSIPELHASFEGYKM